MDIWVFFIKKRFSKTVNLFLFQTLKIIIIFKKKKILIILVLTKIRLFWKKEPNYFKKSNDSRSQFLSFSFVFFMSDTRTFKLKKNKFLNY